MPQYVVPLLTCTCGAMFALSGLAPTLQDLNSFRDAPKGARDLSRVPDYLVVGVGAGFRCRYRDHPDFLSLSDILWGMADLHVCHRWDCRWGSHQH